MRYRSRSGACGLTLLRYKPSSYHNAYVMRVAQLASSRVAPRSVARVRPTRPPPTEKSALRASTVTHRRTRRYGTPTLARRRARKLWRTDSDGLVYRCALPCS